MTTITIQSEGRRHYLIGQTYALRESIRAAGGHWDADRKAWWFGKRETAEQIVGAAPAPAPDAPTDRDAGPGADALVAARAEYQGRRCYLAGRIVQGRTHWDDRVHTVTSRGDVRVLLYSMDGSRQFWAARSEVTVSRTYGRPQTIGGLRAFAEGVRAGTVPVCRYCGSPSCEGVRGGLCEQD